MKLKDKYAIVTGASTGIGRAIAVQFAKEGAFVALVARREDRLSETKRMIEENGGKAKVFITDLSNIESVNKMIGEIKSDTIRIDILANIAGIWHGEDEVYADTDFEKFSQNVILDTYDVGITAPTLLAHAFIPLMPKRGKILNLSGTFESGAKGWLPYYVSKKAIEDLTVGLSQELTDKDIQVNCISPSDTATEEYKKYFPQYIKDAIEPEEIAKEAVRFCSSESDDITGTIKVIKKMGV
ncbi:TPA: hypothetical protein DDW69_01900 [candidate division CPR2 bacterium]|uniref:Short-chain dehydrogenase/reductase SDR n=1 Tax=candidate division CPR2 bacterium GW2011_GWC1_41_48 TaxID=1618344 RepID=A0A0G0YJR8_UNCC2|nr:MAG: hypothetical protein UT47_C0001G0181 [candidate division CPR2 bacterium GW2011_GWC2_39_35]KKR28515.1 MAG: hypothetical protein UT59_C0025G0002 [candidate division CPR2 bacterium GW2011_GWD1_39_7]KKR28698.1 MAG: hypothetical protein UT60_C0014G0009 [candidate division CPR2 bacterium GW2011_GWD2_39_7]KKS09776.1 MAG: short-chain dehydrogenase/reductase SDR [candidate division CPR2 bacterium GW2011_GWC1_41_48]OGB60981.1 MAG: hypothetical protein A2Y27_03405 [candidate division CPR2 bacteriu